MRPSKMTTSEISTTQRLMVPQKMNQSVVLLWRDIEIYNYAAVQFNSVGLGPPYGEHLLGTVSVKRLLTLLKQNRSNTI